jgi:hypothetical protein
LAKEEYKKRQRAQRALSAAVPGFPEIVKQTPRCRLCALAEKEPELLHTIHGMARGGLGTRALASETAHYWSARSVAPMDHKCFARHFEKHVDFDMSDFLDLPVPPPSREPPVVERRRPAAPPRSDADADKGALGKDNSDYYEMWDLIDRLKTRVHQVDEDAVFIDEETGKVDSYSVMMLSKLIGELVRAIEALNRIRNADRVAKAIVQGHTKRMVQLLSDPLISSFQAALTQDEGGDLTALYSLANTETRDIIFKAAERAVKESCEVYKLN